MSKPPAESRRNLPRRSECALFLDVDGVLLDLAPTPSGVVASAGVIDLLERLVAGFDGAVALISGRAIDDLDRIFQPLRLPSAGVHGGERRTRDGVRHAIPIDRRFLAHAEVILGDFVSAHEGALLEPKGLSVAVHTRLARDAQPGAAALVAALAAESGGGFVMQGGQDVHELKPISANKGRALAEFMAESPFRSRRPVAVGDDLTDADAFAEAEMRGGVSVAVGPHAPAAMIRLDSARDARHWLRRWLD